MRSITWTILASCLVCGLLSGCGSSGPKLAKVTGKVTVDGKPVPRADISFTPNEPGGSPSLGKTDKDGNYHLAFTQEKDGALIGMHTVSIASKKISPDEMPDDGSVVDSKFVAIPKKYQAKGALTAEVKNTSNVIDFKLDTK